jgi:hypothetical protein
MSDDRRVLGGTGRTDAVNPAKKVYTRPELVTYGDLTHLTAAVGYMGMADGGMFFMSRTY